MGERGPEAGIQHWHSRQIRHYHSNEWWTEAEADAARRGMTLDRYLSELVEVAMSARIREARAASLTLRLRITSSS